MTGVYLPSSFAIQSNVHGGVPRHVAIIMDGNGRWARQRGLPRWAGHAAGVRKLQPLINEAGNLGTRLLTLFAFSADNWQRPKDEVSGVMTLFEQYLDQQVADLIERETRLTFLGRRDRISPILVEKMAAAEDATALGQGLHLRIAIDYSARHAIAEQALALLTDSALSDFKDTPALHERLIECFETGKVDLLIRTGGEKRLSDFLLWESAYAELVFSDHLWPEYEPQNLREAVAEFLRRDRRFGRVPIEPGLQVVNHMTESNRPSTREAV
jgi:undecaprenyl diphosphate synthase